MSARGHATLLTWWKEPPALRAGGAGGAHRKRDIVRVESRRHAPRHSVVRRHQDCRRQGHTTPAACVQLNFIHSSCSSVPVRTHRIHAVPGRTGFSRRQTGIPHRYLNFTGKHASGEALLGVWDAHTGREVATLEGYGGIAHSCAWSPDGTRLASASDDTTVRQGLTLNHFSAQPEPFLSQKHTQTPLDTP